MNPNELGPGSYNQPSYLGEGPKYTIGEKREGKIDNYYPGPTHYNPDDRMTYEKTPQWKISDNPNGNHDGPLINSNSLGPG